MILERYRVTQDPEYIYQKAFSIGYEYAQRMYADDKEDDEEDKGEEKNKKSNAERILEAGDNRRTSSAAIKAGITTTAAAAGGLAAGYGAKVGSKALLDKANKEIGKDGPIRKGIKFESWMKDKQDKLEESAKKDSKKGGAFNSIMSKVKKGAANVMSKVSIGNLAGHIVNGAYNNVLDPTTRAVNKAAGKLDPLYEKSKELVQQGKDQTKAGMDASYQNSRNQSKANSEFAKAMQDVDLDDDARAAAKDTYNTAKANSKKAEETAQKEIKSGKTKSILGRISQAITAPFHGAKKTEDVAQKVSQYLPDDYDKYVTKKTRGKFNELLSKGVRAASHALENSEAASKNIGKKVGLTTAGTIAAIGGINALRNSKLKAKNAQDREIKRIEKEGGDDEELQRIKDAGQSRKNVAKGMGALTTAATTAGVGYGLKKLADKVKDSKYLTKLGKVGVSVAPEAQKFAKNHGGKIATIGGALTAIAGGIHTARQAKRMEAQGRRNEAKKIIDENKSKDKEN